MVTENDAMFIPNDIDERTFVFSDLQDKQRGKAYKSTFTKHADNLSPNNSEFTGFRHLIGETSSFQTRDHSDNDFDARRDKPQAEDSYAIKFSEMSHFTSHNPLSSKGQKQPVNHHSLKAQY
jgi:hypothetical protein